MDVIEAVKELVKMGLNVQIDYDKEKDMLYYDLNTGAKSHLYLYEDWSLAGRYDYSSSVEDWVENSGDLSNVLRALFYEFKNCLHGREYYNSQWMEIGVKLGCVEKKVQTHTTVTYE
jgi:hypothetical protein